MENEAEKIKKMKKRYEGNRAVKIIANDDGEKVKREWCYIINIDAERTLCTGEAFGYGESSVEYEIKKDCPITCLNCIEIIRQIKKVKL